MIHLKQLLRHINMPGKGGGEARSRCGWWFLAKELYICFSAVFWGFLYWQYFKVSITRQVLPSKYKSKKKFGGEGGCPLPTPTAPSFPPGPSPLGPLLLPATTTRPSSMAAACSSLVSGPPPIKPRPCAVLGQPLCVLSSEFLGWVEALSWAPFPDRPDLLGVEPSASVARLVSPNQGQDTGFCSSVTRASSRGRQAGGAPKGQRGPRVHFN